MSPEQESILVLDVTVAFGYFSVLGIDECDIEILWVDLSPQHDVSGRALQVGLFCTGTGFPQTRGIRAVKRLGT